MTYRILDLDNCIANDGWRIKHIHWDVEDLFWRYHAYHILSPFDDLANVDLLRTDEEIIILTGRPVHYHNITLDWLRHNKVRFKHMIMRNNNDPSPSSQYKPRQLEWLLSYYDVTIEEITSAFDDRPDVIRAYQELGVRNAQVRAAHEIDAYRRPT